MCSLVALGSSPKDFGVGLTRPEAYCLETSSSCPSWSVYRCRQRRVDTSLMAAGDFIDFSTDAESFDLDEYLVRATDGHPELLDYPETRKALTRKNTLLFALVYLRDRLKNQDGQITFSDYHLWFHRWASQTWIKPVRRLPLVYRALRGRLIL